MKYLIVIEETDMEGLINFHIEGMHAEQIEVPTPHSNSMYVEVPA